MALPPKEASPITDNLEMVVVAKVEIPLNTTLPVASKVFIVVVLLTVNCAMVVVAKVFWPFNSTAPLAIKVLSVEVLITVRLPIVVVAKLEIPLTVKFPTKTELPVVVELPFKINPAKVGVEVVVTDWSIDESPNKYKLLPPPTIVAEFIMELFKVELEANKPEMVEVPIVEVAIVDEVMAFVPVKIVLPPCKVNSLPLPFKVMRSIVDVEIVDEVMVLLPIKVVLPPCKAKVLLFKFKVPLPAEMVLPLKVFATKAPDKVSAVPEAVVKIVCPVTLRVDCNIAAPTKKVPLLTVRDEEEAFPKVVWPITLKLLLMVAFVADAFVNVDCPVTYKLLEIDVLVVEAFPKVVWPVTVSSLMVVLAKVDVPLAVKVVSVVEPMTASWLCKITLPVNKPLPSTTNLLPGVVVPIPTFPLCVTRKTEVREEDAMSNGS